MNTVTVNPIIHDGYFTVVGEFGHRTFRIETQPDGASFAPGKQIMAYRVRDLGRESEWVNFAFVNGRFVNPWKRFQSGYEVILKAARFLVTGDKHTEAGKMYALESGNCCVCNRTLTTPESIAAGIGPTCAGRM